MSRFSRVTRRLVLVVVACLALMLVAVPLASAAKKVTITFWQAGGDDLSIPCVRELVREFQSKNPDIEVRYQAIPWAEDPHTKYQAAIAGGTVADVLSVGSPFEHTLAAADALEPLDKYMSKEMKADFFPHLLEMSQFKGQQVAIPWFTDCRALFYRKDLLAAEGIPEPTTSWTWDQFLTYAKKLTKDLNGDGIIDQYGFGTSGRYGSQWTPFVRQNGGNFVDEERWVPTANDPAVIEGLQFYVDLIRVHKVTPPGITTILLNEIQKMFAEGKVAMFVDCGDTANRFQKEPQLSGKFGVGLMPHNKAHATFAGADAFVITKHSKNKEAAWKFLEFMVSPEAMAKYCEASGFLPVRKSLGEHPIFKDPIKQGFIKQLEAGVYFTYKHPQGSQVTDIIRAAVQEAMEGTKTVQQAMNDAQKQLQQIMKP
ncbi:MAG: ABC transporter substrate-binding protein [Firmicutes bacterium]|nr:ABC transporter substrate-binding protein [Bacillota bacterium]